MYINRKGNFYAYLILGKDISPHRHTKPISRSSALIRETLKSRLKLFLFFSSGQDAASVVVAKSVAETDCMLGKVNTVAQYRLGVFLSVKEASTKG